VSVPASDASTEELRAAHDVLAEVYADRLAGALDVMPVDRAVLGLFASLVVPGGTVVDVGCGTGRLAPFLAAHGLVPRGVDLSPEMVRVARRDHPGLDVRVADLRALPFADGELDGAVCWYSLMYLAPAERPAAYRELARVLRPGAPLATAYKAGDGRHRRGGRTLDLGIEFDIWWHAPEELERDLVAAGFEVACWAGRSAGDDEVQPQGYLVVTRRPGA
jgi:SAM-dependent methyltransferase